VTNPASGSTSGDEARKPIAVFLLDDHEIVRRGVRDLLEAEPDIRVVGEAGTASSALARILAAMYSDGPAPQQLSRDECLQLMASVSMGRIIYTRQALPAKSS
jgi:hypothetical protein